MDIYVAYNLVLLQTNYAMNNLPIHLCGTETAWVKGNVN
jgi:hypothetical protein